jgi:serine O-acetyltransferase
MLRIGDLGRKKKLANTRPTIMRWTLLFASVAPINSFLTLKRHCFLAKNYASASLNAFASIQDQFENGTRPEPVLHSMEDLDDDEAWQSSLELAEKPYVSSLFTAQPEWKSFLESLTNKDSQSNVMDPLWEQVKKEAMDALGPEPAAGPQLYLGILSQPCLFEAIVTIIANEIETELMQATELKNLFLSMLTPEDDISIHLDVMAVAMRSQSVGNAMMATLFHNGLHALVCYRVGHRLWLEGRTGLAYYMQSTVSRKYSADIHPAAQMGSGVYLNTGGGVVIGETAVVGNDVSIFQGVTLGGTGKEAGDRHPKVGDGVILHDGATVLGNIRVGDGAVITAKSIVTKPVPPLARVSGIPAKVIGYRECTNKEFEGDYLEQHLGFKYMERWQELTDLRVSEE